MAYAHYCQLAELFDFPGPEFCGKGRALLESLRESHPEAAPALAEFLDGFPETTLDQQELHTRTFDIQCITSLEIGYVLFGDDYKRGAILSNLNREHNLAENDCRGELADHLPNLLRLLPKLGDDELRQEMVSELLLPALTRMEKEFEPSRIEKKNAAYRKHYKTLIDQVRDADPGIYRLAFKTALDVIARDFDLPDGLDKSPLAGMRPQTADFLGMIQRELEIEYSANPVNSGCDA
jgi:nitrate reductase assembly molybdenum cofactor insertion protein NarJ